MTAAIAAILFAVSISSDKIDSFMKLPDWMPTEVDAVHTFGSDDRTNCTRRTTLDTLAAVESVFDAYYERMLFFSEGRSNDWDVVRYGTRPTSEEYLNQVEFTNFNNAANRMFVYQTASTNVSEYPRPVADTRRLVEFENMFALSGKLTGEVFEDPFFPGEEREGRSFSGYEGIFLPYFPTWIDGNSYGTANSFTRMVYVGSSWMPDSLHPDAFDWRSTFPDLSEWAVTNCCLPIWECAPDGHFRSCDSYRSGRSYFGLQERWIEGFANGDVDGFVASLKESRPWVGQTVPDLIRSKFPEAGPERGVSNVTRRLVKDDYLTYDVMFTYDVIGQRTATFDFSSVRPDGTEITTDVLPVGTYDYSEILEYDFDYAGGEIGGFKLNGYNSSWGCYDEITTSETMSLGPPPDGSSYASINLYETTYPSGTSAFDRQSSTGFSWRWGNPRLKVVVDYYGPVIQTNAVYTNSSIVATLSRSLAMLDRSYEIAGRYYIRDNKVTSNVVRRLSAFSSASGRSPIMHGPLDYPWRRINDQTYYLEEKSPAEEETVISLSQGQAEVSDVTSCEGFNEGLVAKFRFSGLSSYITSPGYSSIGLSAHLTNVVEGASEPPEREGARYYYKIEPDAGSEIYLLSREVGATDLAWARKRIVIDIDPDAHISAVVNISQSATLSVTSPALSSGVDRCFPWFGPGRLSFSSRRVEECHCSTLARIAKLVGVRKSDGSFEHEGVESISSDISLPYPGNNYSQSALYKMDDVEVNSPNTVINHIANALSDGWARNKLHDVCRADMPEGFSPSMLNPSLSLLVLNAGRIAKFQGGYYIITCPATGDSRWPADGQIQVSFSVNDTGEKLEINTSRAFTAPVCGDLTLSDPLISTQWKWKALRSTEN